MSTMAITISERELEALVERKVSKAMREASIDPDFGLELRPEFVREIKARAKTKKRIPFETIKRRYL